MFGKKSRSRSNDSHQKGINYKCLVRYLNSRSIDYSKLRDINPQNPPLLIQLETDSKFGTIPTVASCTSFGISFQGICPLNATEDAYDDVLRVITKVGYASCYGWFCMDQSDGEIQARSYLIEANDFVDDDAITQALSTISFLYDTYDELLLKAIKGHGLTDSDFDMFQ